MNSIKLPLIALRDLIVFPRMVTHFDCGRDKTIAAIEAAEMNGGKIFLVAQKDANLENVKRDDLYNMGTIAIIKQMLKLPGGIVRVLVEGVNRAEILEFSTGDTYMEALLREYEESEEIEDIELEAAKRLVEEDINRYSELDQKLIPGLLQSVVDISSASSLVDTAAAYINLNIKDGQKILDCVNVHERIVLFHSILKKEIELLSIEKNIDKKVRSNMNKVQREYYLKEQLKVIHEELGDESESNIYASYEKKLSEKKLPEVVREKANKELSKLSKLNMMSPEYSMLLGYLDWILDLPWLEETKDDIDLKNARAILDQDHYGLKKVKERILEFIAVKKLSSSKRGPILCLVGPPGVGKTSIATSIAKALNKEFVRMSLGGVTDESEIRGHRRTYIGALPGRIITLLKKAKQNNPLLLFDEIDKVGNSYRGDPASALLEVLDPEQNSTFTDRYMEVPFDLSNVFFVTTANTTSTIPRPLLDRMEIIRLEGYTPLEKFNIAKKYLIPKMIKETGLTNKNFKINDSAIKSIIDSYTREAGVRNLEKEIFKCGRKAALNLIEDETKKVSITTKNISDYLGPKKFLFDTVDKKDGVGIVNGLAWTEVGGTTLQIETTIMDGKGNLTLTGQLGNVMKESAIAAISYIASNSKKFNLNSDFKQKNDIHIHVPEGAVPKDGPSAGVSMVTSVVSALTKIPVKKDVAMTGEITLTGRVLAIGGLKEKLLAAQRMGIKSVIIPFENKRDLVELEEELLNKLNIIPVKKIDEVIENALVKKC